MAKYYAVDRSLDHLAHYGIKGMKWGVRKALEQNNDRKLRRQYRKARRKLLSLKLKSNWYLNEQRGNAWEKVSHIPGVNVLTGSHIRSKYYYAKSSDIGDVLADRKRDKFEAAMKETFKGTKYDIDKMNRQKARRKARIMKKLHIKRSKKK